MPQMPLPSGILRGWTVALRRLGSLTPIEVTPCTQLLLESSMETQSERADLLKPLRHNTFPDSATPAHCMLSPAPPGQASFGPLLPSIGHLQLAQAPAYLTCFPCGLASRHVPGDWEVTSLVAWELTRGSTWLRLNRGLMCDPSPSPLHASL